MMNPEARLMIDLYLAKALKAESEAVAEANLAYASGMIGYAVACGDITPNQHSAEWDSMKLVREQRIQRRIDGRKLCA